MVKIDYPCSNIRALYETINNSNKYTTHVESTVLQTRIFMGKKKQNFNRFRLRLDNRKTISTNKLYLLKLTYYDPRHESCRKCVQLSTSVSCSFYLIRKLCNQLVNMKDDIVDPRSNCSLGLKHPFYKLVESIRIWRIRPCWPFDLCINNC